MAFSILKNSAGALLQLFLFSKLQIFVYSCFTMEVNRSTAQQAFSSSFGGYSGTMSKKRHRQIRGRKGENDRRRHNRRAHLPRNIKVRFFFWEKKKLLLFPPLIILRSFQAPTRKQPHFCCYC